VGAHRVGPPKCFQCCRCFHMPHGWCHEHCLGKSQVHAFVCMLSGSASGCAPNGLLDTFSPPKTHSPFVRLSAGSDGSKLKLIKEQLFAELRVVTWYKMPWNVCYRIWLTQRGFLKYDINFGLKYWEICVQVPKDWRCRTFLKCFYFTKQALIAINKITSIDLRLFKPTNFTNS